MKKIFLVMVVALLAIQGNAQDLNFGVKGGLNLANFTGDDAGDTDMRTAFHLGVLAEYMINEQFAIQPEVLFSAQGAKIKNKLGELDVKLGYVNVPVMFKYYVAPGFSLQAGPQVSFLVDSKVEHDNKTVTDALNKLGIADKDNYKTVDFGLNFGLGYKFDNNIFVEGRYNLGLTKIHDKGDAKVKNGVFQFSVGYMF